MELTAGVGATMPTWTGIIGVPTEKKEINNEIKIMQRTNSSCVF